MKKYAGQTLTISLYARGSSAMTLYGDNSIRAVAAGNTSTDSRVGDYTNIDITTSWQRYTRTITLDASYTAGNDHLFILFQVSSQPSSAWLEITGVQVETGDTATPFEHRSFGEELALCQRYYQRFEHDTDFAVIWSGDVTSGQGYYISQILHTEMRTNGTYTFLSTSEHGMNTPQFQNTTKNTVKAFADASSTGARRYFQFDFDVDAEL